MNKSVKHICKDIRNGKLPEENIPKLFNYMVDYNETYAYVRFAMQYYAFYEAFIDDEDTWSAEAKSLIADISKHIQNDVLQGCSGADREEAIKAVDTIRNKIMKRMEILAAYTDIFRTHEYVLNRVEYRFKETDTSLDTEEFAREILRYIFNSEDNLVINEKIKEIIGQLPVRITKQKYFDLLKESLQIYLGADKSSLDTYLYILRTSALLTQEPEMNTFYPTLWERKEFLASLDYKAIDRENYEKALSQLRAAVFILETEQNLYYSLQEIINEVYVLLLCSTYSGMTEGVATEAKEAALHIIKEINQLFTLGRKEELPAELTEGFSKLEGVQEDISFELSMMEDAFFTVETQYKELTKSLMLGQLFQTLRWVNQLHSSSIFIELGKEQEETKVNETVLAQVMKELEQDLSELFASCDKMIYRAVMANTMNKMPVFFNSHKEVMDYVLYALERCSDPYEKAAVAEIINTIMSE